MVKDQGIVPDLGERIRRCRVLAHLSQKEVAEQTGVSDAAVSSYEAGQTSPRAEWVARFASMVGEDPTWLLTGERPTTLEPTTTTTHGGGEGPEAVAVREERWRCSVCLSFLAKDEAVCPTCGRLIIWPPEA